MNGGITSGYPVSWHEISLPEKTNKQKSAEKKSTTHAALLKAV